MLLWMVSFALSLATIAIAYYVWRLGHNKGKSNYSRVYKDVPLVYEDMFREYEKKAKVEDVKDEVDEHLDKLSQQLGLTEGDARRTRCKIRQTKEEMSNIDALDNETRDKYVQLMNVLHDELDKAEKESRLLQSRIEKVTQKRVAMGHQMEQGRQKFRCAAAQLAARIGERHKGCDTEPLLLRDKSSFSYIHRHTEPGGRRAGPTNSLIKIWTNDNAYVCSNDMRR